MEVRTNKFFNKATRQALGEGWDYNYGRLTLLEEDIENIKKGFGLDRLIRLDRNISPFGFSSNVLEFLDSKKSPDKLLKEILKNEPILSRLRLRQELGKIYGVEATQIVISTGIDNLIDIISRALFEHEDHYLCFAPDYPRFDMYSERTGALPSFVFLNEAENFAITRQKIEDMKMMTQRYVPKVIWISNPNNPTGQTISQKDLLEIIRFARDLNTFVVVDEAQAEFISTPPVGSIIHYIQKNRRELLEEYPNLIVLRTLSKAYGLSSLRVGYLMTANQAIVKAVLLYRPRLVITNMNLNLCIAAINDDEHLKRVAIRVAKNRKNVFDFLDTLSNFTYVTSYSNTFILKHRKISAVRLFEEFKRFGLILNPIKSAFARVEDNYLRVALGLEEDNEEFCRICSQVNDIEFPEKPKYNNLM